MALEMSSQVFALTVITAHMWSERGGYGCQRSIGEFPEEAKLRLRSLTSSKRLRMFSAGITFCKIDPAWLFVCFEVELPLQPLISARQSAGITSDEWALYPYDDDTAREYVRGGSKVPSIGMFGFSSREVARRGFAAIEEPNFLSDQISTRGSHLVFARGELEVFLQGKCI